MSRSREVAAGTFTTFTSTGIDDNATSNVMTIDSSGNTTLGGNLVIPDSGTIGSASDTDAITIDISGNVTLAGTANDIGTVTSGTFNGTIGSSSSQCAMAAKLSSQHTMTANPQQIPFNTLLVNNIGTLDTSTNTGRWTCDTNGVYYISFNINYYSLNNPSFPSAYLEASIRKNSAGSSATIGYATLLDHKGGDHAVGFNVSACASLVNTDTVDLALTYSSSSGAKIVYDYSYFLVWKID